MGLGFVSLIAVASFLFGVIVAVCVSKSKKSKSGAQGTVYTIRNNDECRPYLFLEASVPIEDIASQTTVVFNVIDLSDNSRK